MILILVASLFIALVELVLALTLLFAVNVVLVVGVAERSAQSTAAKGRIWMGAGSERLDRLLRSSGLCWIAGGQGAFGGTLREEML